MTNDRDDLPARADALIAETFASMRADDRRLPPELAARLLADYDRHQRRRRDRLSLRLFADAFGWRALARPVAAASVIASLLAGGFVAGAAAAPSPSAELASALAQSFGAAGEDAWDAE